MRFSSWIFGFSILSLGLSALLFAFTVIALIFGGPSAVVSLYDLATSFVICFMVLQSTTAIGFVWWLDNDISDLIIVWKRRWFSS